MPTQTVEITPSVLRWAADEDGLSVSDLSERLDLPEPLIAAWMEGEAQPTKGQFSHLTEVLRRPRALFFMPAPPQRAGLPADLRSAPGLLEHKLSPAERRLMRKAMRLQAEASWLLQRRGGPLTIPVATLETPPGEAGRIIRAWLGVQPSVQMSWPSAYEALRKWRLAAEARGVIPLQLQLGSKGIRGFSLVDEYAPLLATNTAYNPAARIFTIFHELAHLVARAESACASFYAPTSGSSWPRLERWCEEVASAALLPDSEMRGVVSERFGGHIANFDDARRLADRFKVSIRAVAIRVIKLNLAAASLYADVEANAPIVDRTTQAGGGGSGRVTAQKRVDEYGRRLPGLVLDAAREREVSLRDAVSLMGVTTSELADLERLVGSQDAV